MASFAKLDENNVVTQTVKIGNATNIEINNELTPSTWKNKEI